MAIPKTKFKLIAKTKIFPKKTINSDFSGHLISSVITYYLR